MKLRKKPLPLEFILNFYDAYLRDSCTRKNAEVLGMTRKGLELKIAANADLQTAKKLADERRKSYDTLAAYVYRSLSPEAKEVWLELKKAEGLQAINAIFAHRPLKLRQQLFAHSLVTTAYDLSLAMKRVGISYSMLHEWKKDHEFLQLLEEIQFYRKNYFEKALLGLVEEKHPGAVIFVNRTINADRGYSEKLDITHHGSLQPEGVNLDELELDTDTRRKILLAIRQKNSAENALQNAKPVLELQAA